MNAIFTTELEQMTNDQLQEVRREHADSGTRRRAKKILKKRGVELVGDVNRKFISWSKPKVKGVVTFDDSESERSLACVKAAVVALVNHGGIIEHRSDSGSVYVRLGDGRLVRVSDHVLPSNAIRDMRAAEFNEPWDEELIYTGRRSRITPDVARRSALALVGESD